MGAPPSTQARTFVSHAGSKIAVRLLSLGDDVNHRVEIVVEFGIVMNSQRIAGTLDDLIRIGIVEREITLVFAFDKTCSNGKVVETTINLTLVEGRRYAHRTIYLDTWRPETIVEVDLCKAHLLNRSVRLLLGGTTHRECD